ncbi:hypothetical protein Verru16b_02708 [Lacunisphaera limnophila]|uniref:DUF1570 domain-containing protein n=2 Tax=Lacunisphaera limnophila TaxID=1838286 RepID=A0A1D8AXK7_9BACT|nr:hypothetical protein Verru16b_02708 [Lacunisphaera limnophila]
MTARLTGGLILLSCLARPLVGADDVVTAGETLELPTLTVTEQQDLPPVESWQHTRIADFEVLTNASERETRRLLADFHKFRQAVRLVWPVSAQRVVSASLILCGGKNSFDPFLPAGPARGDQLVPSLLLRNREQIAIVVDLQTQLVAINDPAALLATGGAAAEYQVDHYRQLYREYVHFLLSQSEVRPPAWMEEGLAQTIMDIELTRKTLIFGKIDSYKGSASGGSPLEAAADDATVAGAIVGEQPFNIVLQNRRFIPFARFLAITHDDPEAVSPLGNNLWAKQAYAFVHYCLFGEKLKYKEALVQFVGRLAREPLSEELFRDCFKVGYADMEKQLRAYLRYTRHQYQKYELQDSDLLAPADIALATASPAQIGLIKGDALRLALQPAAAHQEYRLAYRRGSREPALLAGLGQVDPEPENALKYLNVATKEGLPSPTAHAALARLRLDGFKAEQGTDGRLTNAQMAGVLAPLFKARTLPPPLPEVYATIAEAWSLSAVSPKPEHLKVLDEGIRLFPRHSALLYQAAVLYRQAGVPANTRAIAQLALRYPQDETQRARFEALLAELPPAN